MTPCAEAHGGVAVYTATASDAARTPRVPHANGFLGLLHVPGGVASAAAFPFVRTVARTCTWAVRPCCRRLSFHLLSGSEIPKAASGSGIVAATATRYPRHKDDCDAPRKGAGWPIKYSWPAGVVKFISEKQKSDLCVNLCKTPTPHRHCRRISTSSPHPGERQQVRAKRGLMTGSAASRRMQAGALRPGTTTEPTTPASCKPDQAAGRICTPMPGRRSTAAACRRLLDHARRRGRNPLQG